VAMLIRSDRTSIVVDLKLYITSWIRFRLGTGS